MTRPPIALERLTERDDGCVEYAFRKPWRDGTRAVVLTAEDLLARLCAMVPPPRFHLTRYAGVLASNAALRAEVVTGGAKKAACLHQQDCPEGPMQGELFGEERAQLIEENDSEKKPTRHPWAWLLKRVFAVEVLVCVHCAGKLRLVEIATEATAIKRIIQDERRRRGEPVSEMEARGPPRGPPGQPAREDRSRFGEGDRVTLRDFAGAKRPAVGGECGLSLGKRCSRRENARGMDAAGGRRFARGSRWPEIERVAGRSKPMIEGLGGGFVV